MTRKTKNIIILSVILVLVLAAGVTYAVFIQGKEILKKNTRVSELRRSSVSREALLLELKQVEGNVSIVDSLLALSDFNIPANIPEEKFYDFVDAYSSESFIYTGTSVDFMEKKVDKGINYYVYRLHGTGRFIDVYNLIYAIEHSKELKRISSAEINANTVVNSEGIPRYLVNFDLLVDVYFANNDQYMSSRNNMEMIVRQDVYNAYYPLIRNEILPNYDDLPDIQNAELISLVPQGAFIKDDAGNTYLMEKGEKVYLGYLTDIDYTARKVTFTLNKGGIIEELVIEMGSKRNKK